MRRREKKKVQKNPGRPTRIESLGSHLRPEEPWVKDQSGKEGSRELTLERSEARDEREADLILGRRGGREGALREFRT